MGSSQPPHIVILGAGFGGLAAARALARAPVRVTLVDRQNHHLFQPLLYQVATAALSPADIAAPIRSIVKSHANVRVLLDSAEAIDVARKQVGLKQCGTIDYDYLIIATGARHSYFTNPEWESYAPGLKTVDDATKIRRAVLLALEYAEIETDKPRRDALLTYVVIGGGPTGVEMAGAIAELAHQSVSKEFRHITPHCSRIILVDSGDRLLKSFPEPLSRKAEAQLRALGVEVKLGMRITELHDHGVKVGDTWIAAQTIVWAAGVMASPAGEWLGIGCDRAGRIPVGADLRVNGHSDVFAIGDTAACHASDGTLLPGVAAVAKQQGHHVATLISAAYAGRSADRPFRYRNYGNIATIGRKRAVADFGRIRLSGFAAWLLWCIVHVWFLAGYRNRFTVGANWLWSYITFGRSARLITGLGGETSPTLVTQMM